MTSADSALDRSVRFAASQRWLLLAAGVLGFGGVLVGSFGAHGLESYLAGRGYDAELIEKRLDQFDVGARYHLLHSIALLALASSLPISDRARRWVGWLLVAGIALFSGSLYLLVLTNTPWLGAITPLGGLSWIVGWIVLAVAAFRSDRG